MEAKNIKDGWAMVQWEREKTLEGSRGGASSIDRSRVSIDWFPLGCRGTNHRKVGEEWTRYPVDEALRGRER